MSGRPEYEAIECFKAPKQGRSGGGLFTDNGYLAGVCDFAEPQGDHGLYATPRSIYKLLDRNDLMALYAPPNRGTGTLVADRRSGSRPVPAAAKPFARSQSPDREEPAGGRAVADDPNVVMIPPPTFLGIVVPEFPREERAARAASTTRRTNWLPTRTPAAASGDKASDRAKQSDSNLDDDEGQDRFDPPSDEQDPFLRNESDHGGRNIIKVGCRRHASWLAIETAMASRQTGNGRLLGRGIVELIDPKTATRLTQSSGRSRVP